jgi:hypothetical protein
VKHADFRFGSAKRLIYNKNPQAVCPGMDI